MKRGVQLYTVRDYLENPKQVEESLRKIKAIGYDSVQGWAAGGLTAKEYIELCGKSALRTVRQAASMKRCCIVRRR